MSNPTSNFGWQMPTPTDLVTDLPADFEVFGQAVDSSMADLKGGTSGQILSKATNTDMDFTWIDNQVGDITAVTADAPLTGGGTTGAISIGIQDGTTAQKGAVQLTDSTSSTSTTTAATPKNVKAAYDLAAAAIPLSTATTAGDLLYRNGSTVTRLGIGTAGQVLKVNSGATAPEWGTSSSGGDVVRIATSSFSASSAVNIDSCFSSTYDNYFIHFNVNSTSGSNALQLRLRSGGSSSSAASYGNTWKYNQYGSGGATGNLGSASGSTLIYLHDLTGYPAATVLNVMNPFAAFDTQFTWLANQSNGYGVTGAGQFVGTTSFDGISFISAAGTITGTISVYGYKKA